VSWGNTLSTALCKEPARFRVQIATVISGVAPAKAESQAASGALRSAFPFVTSGIFESAPANFQP